MSELSQTLSKGFEGMTNEDPVVAGQALRDYKEEVTKIDSELGGLEAEHLAAELASVGSKVHTKIGSTVEALLGAITYKPLDGGEEIVMFQNGSSMVVIDSQGRLVSYYHKPLDDETLKGYGSHLKWGLANSAHTRLAHAQTGEDIDTEEGYATATRAAKDMSQGQTHHDYDDFNSLIHLGSTVVEDDEKGDLYASTSGMLLRDEVINDILNGPDDNPLVKLAKEAVTTGADDKFKGNIFIGSLESAFSKAVLQVVLGHKTVEEVVAEWSLDSLISQREQGINIH